MMLTLLTVDLIFLTALQINAHPSQQPLLSQTDTNQRILQFRPAQVHTTSLDGSVNFRSLSISKSGPGTKTKAATPVILATPKVISRPKSNPDFQHARWRSKLEKTSTLLEWEDREVFAPDVTSMETLAQLARISANAYDLPGGKDWWDIDGDWNANNTTPIGWEPDDDGFRGHVFTSMDNSTVILSIKGTSPILGATTKKDKFNDNLMFSCCCARVDAAWVFNTVCDCYSGGSKCDQGCLEEALIEDSLFYSVGTVSSL